VQHDSHVGGVTTGLGAEINADSGVEMKQILAGYLQCSLTEELQQARSG
jgi:hypothetical protein